MAVFRERPVLVEAEQFWPDRVVANAVFWEAGRCWVNNHHGNPRPVQFGDWIVKRPGGHEVVRHAEFTARYEPLPQAKAQFLVHF